MSTASSELALFENLSVKGFRAISDLEIPRLGRVNLFVGKNQVGKTSLLEAIRLYASGATLDVLREILTSRDEDRLDLTESGATPSIAGTYLNLFHGRPKGEQHLTPIEIRGNVGAISISLEWPEPTVLDGVDDDPRLHSPSLRVEKNGHRRRIRLDRKLEGRGPVRVSHDQPSLFLGAAGVRGQELAKLWDQIALSDLEGEVLRGLQILIGDLERISYIADAGGRRFPLAKLRGEAAPVPLRSLGDGAIKALRLAIALVSSRNGYLLIDEVEAGIHYSVQFDLWRFLIQNAQRLNVQIFATTHSLDCVSAFSQATSVEPAEGVLTRLNRVNGSIVATQFDESDLKVVARERIEIR